MFEHFEYKCLSNLFDRHPPYRGYKPEVKESPNSDGVVDKGKRYLHVALKYDPPQYAIDILARAHFEACRIAETLDLPSDFYPKVENGTLRVLEYPPGEGSAEHTDFDLFTVNLWRSTPTDHEQRHDNESGWLKGPCVWHMGRLGEMLGKGKAISHRVQARPYSQQALVYFAMPANSAEFPDGTYDENEIRWEGHSVQEWLDQIYSKSRVYKL